MKDQALRIKRNSLFAFLSHLSRMLTNVVLFISIARVYGPEEFGQFTAAHTLATIFLFLADFGFDTLLVSEIGRDREKAPDLVRRYLSMKILFALGATALMVVTALLQSVSPPTRVLMYIFSSFVISSALMNFFFALFKGYEEMHHETRISFVANLALLGAVLLLGYANASLTVVALAFTASRLIGLALALHTANRLGPLARFRFTMVGKADLGLIVVFGLHALFGNLFFVQDTLLLSAWSGDHQVGIYQSVFKLVAVILVIQEVIVIALLPVLSRLHTENTHDWSRLGGLMNKTLFLAALPITLLLVVYAEQIISLVYGAAEYGEAVPILRVFGVIILIRFAVEAYALMLTTSQRQRTRLTVVIAGTVVNLAVNWYAIPAWGTLGAAVVSLGTNLLVGVGYIAATGKLFHGWFMNARHIVPLVSAVALGIVLWNVRSFPLWYAAPPAILCYGLIAYLIGFTRGERALVFSRGSVAMPSR